MIVVITGPTCTGKSEIAVEVAKRLNGEIINGDAFQIYKELNIGTAKPSNDDMEGIPHHLFDYVNPDEKYSIYNYQKDARKVIDEILKRNNVPIIVGGSGLYIRAALLDYNFSENNNPLDMSDYERLNNEELHDVLKKIDPTEASKIHPNNRKRVLRAISIYLTFNKTKTEIIEEQEHKFVYDDVKIYSISMDKKEIYSRIENRVIKMFEKGLINEVSELSKKYGNNIQAMNAIGYKEIVSNPNMDSNDLIKLIQKNTRNYAKRQITFIKHQYGVIKYARNAFDILDDIAGDDISLRSIALVGEDNYKKIQATKVMVIGIGGVGGIAAEALVRSGVETLYIADDDIVKGSNLNRQILYTQKDLGEYKVDVAYDRFENINYKCKVYKIEKFFNEENVDSYPFDKVDYVIDAIDSIQSKITLIKTLVNKGIKFISSLGMGNRIECNNIYVTTLDKTKNDPLAKRLRRDLKKEGVDLSKVNVVINESDPIRKGGVVTSMIFTPSVAGLTCANYIIRDIIKGDKYGTKEN